MSNIKNEFKQQAKSGAVKLTDANLGDSDANEILSTFKEFPDITELDLSGNQLGDAGAKTLAEILSHKVGRKRGFLSKMVKNDSFRLVLCRNQIGDAGATSLANTAKDALSSSKCLVKVDLRNNQIGGPGAKAVAEAFASTTTTAFGISHNNVGDEGGIALAKAILGKQMMELSLIGAGLTDGCVQALCDCLGSGETSIKQLDISHNQFTPAGVKQMCKTLAEAPKTKLAQIVLSNNQVAEEGAEGVALLLNSNAGRELQSVTLESAQLSDQAVKNLGEGLRTHPRMTVLDLQNNAITNQGVRTIADFLHGNSVLGTLKIAGNSQIGSDGVSTLSSLILAHRTPLKIDVCGDESPQQNTTSSSSSEPKGKEKKSGGGGFGFGRKKKNEAPDTNKTKFYSEDGL